MGGPQKPELTSEGKPGCRLRQGALQPRKVKGPSAAAERINNNPNPAVSSKSRLRARGVIYGDARKEKAAEEHFSFPSIMATTTLEIQLYFFLLEPREKNIYK